jgi:predicted transcriptional regulator
MATNLLDLTADIVIAHASVTEMTSDDLLSEINMVYATLEAIAKGGKAAIAEKPGKESQKQARKTKQSTAESAEVKPGAAPVPAMTIEEAFKPDHVGCMICGKTGMVTMKRHLASAHDLKPGQYRKKFNIPREQPLAAMEYVAKRRQAALDRGLGAKLVAAREAKKARELGE